MAQVDLSLPDVMKGITLDIVVTGARRTRVRIWAGGQLLKLGARVMGCDVDVCAEPTHADVIRYQPLDGGPERVVYGRRVRS